MKYIYVFPELRLYLMKWKSVGLHVYLTILLNRHVQFDNMLKYDVKCFVFILQVFPLISCRFLIQWHLLGIWCYWQRNTVFFIWTLVIHIIHVSNVRKLKNTVNEKVTYLHSNLQLSSECTPVMSMSLTKSKSLIFSNYFEKFLRSFSMAKIVLIF